MLDNSFTTYNGNCHCGLFKFELNIPKAKRVTACSCMICFKKDYLWVFIDKSQLVVIRGADSLVDYKAAGQERIHKFCPICGSGVLMEKDHHGESESTLQINARMLVNVNPFSLEISSFDNQQCPESTNIPRSFIGDLPIPNHEIEGSELYTGSCACGAVSLAVKTKPFPETEIREDNCSICQRNANTCIYPHRSQVTITGKESCTEYLFGRKFTGHCFCKICGVSVYMKIHGPPKAMFDSWPEPRKEAVKGKLEILPLRIRLLDGVEWDQVDVVRSDEGTGGYVVE